MTAASQHPKSVLAFHWRSKRRILNIAIALRGKSTGWGRPDRHWWSGNGNPRRWFIGHVAAPMLGRRRGFDITFHRGLAGQEKRRVLVNAMSRPRHTATTVAANEGNER